MSSPLRGVECNGSGGGGRLSAASRCFTEVVVVRHGETTWNASRIIQVCHRYVFPSLSNFILIPSFLCIFRLFNDLSAFWVCSWLRDSSSSMLDKEKKTPVKENILDLLRNHRKNGALFLFNTNNMITWGGELKRCVA